MSRLRQVPFLSWAGCMLAAAPGGSSLPLLKTRSPAALFLPTPGVALQRHGQFSPHPVMGVVLVGAMWNGIKCRGLSARPVRRALCSVAVAAGDGPGDISAVGVLAEAKARLFQAESELDAVEYVLRKAEEAVPVDAQRVAKAELGVAEAELGVAKAKLGVAEAKLGVAEAKLGVAEAKLGVAKAEWQAGPDSEKAVFLASLETAQESVRTANMAYEKALNSPTATPQQATVLTVKTKTGMDRKTVHTSTIEFFSEADFKSFSPFSQIWHMKEVKGRPDERISLMMSLVDAVNASQQPSTYLFWDNPDDILRDDVSFFKGAEKNRETGLEQETTKAIACCDILKRDFGPLSVMNDGSPVVFEGIDGVMFECGGLVKNTRQVLLNEAKATPTLETVVQLKMTARRLHDVLTNPKDYTSRPDGVLSELDGLTDVVPVMSGYRFDAPVIRDATLQGIRCAIKNGNSYSVI